MEIFTCKPKNWGCCVDVRKDKDDQRSKMIRDAYNKGMRMRLDADGIRHAMKHEFVPITCIAIDRRQESR